MTKWSEKEIRTFRKLLPIPEEDLVAVERYYRWNFPPNRDKNVLRHDLQTLLNNFAGEVDRAKIFAEKQAAKVQAQPRKIIPLPPPAETELSEAERAQFAADYEKLMGRAWKG